ncbi:kinase-like protein, partial [Clavulina sp. PMI_390]
MSRNVKFADLTQPHRQVDRESSSDSDGGEIGSHQSYPASSAMELLRIEPEEGELHRATSNKDETVFEDEEQEQLEQAVGETRGKYRRWSNMTDVESESENEMKTSESDDTWGRLYPCIPDLPIFVCRMPKLVYLMGRARVCDFVIHDNRVSSIHCTISRHLQTNILTIDDHSTNGTYINGRLIGKGKREVITGSSTVSFGEPGDGRSDAIRFIFRCIDDPHAEELGGGLYGKYQQLEELGSGSFGVVHKLHDRTTGKLAAVKAFAKVQMHRSVDDDIVHSREIDTMVKLRHPNIVPFYEHYHDHEKLYIVMELVYGGDLQMYIRRQPGHRNNEPETKKMTRSICQGLAYIHSKGIAHRDLKPENILLTRDRIPKIADFGQARVIDDQTFLKTVCGTPAYCAPEVLKNLTAGYSPKVDSWSMALIVYFMLTGKHSAWIESDGS